MGPQTPKRTPEEIDQHKQMLSWEITEDDQLDQTHEQFAMGKLNALIAGDTKSIGPEQALALLTIRKEYLRRELTIQLIMHKTYKLEEECDELQVENDELADSMVIQIQFNQSLKKEYEQYKQDLASRDTSYKKPSSSSTKKDTKAPKEDPFT